MEVKKEKNNFFIVVSLLSLTAVLFLASLFLKQEKILEEVEFPVKFQIAEITGLKVDESLDFGRIVHDSMGRKAITIRNYYDFPVEIEFNAEGEVKDYLIFEREIYLEAGESKGFPVSTVVFEDEPYGNYTGILKATFKEA